MISPIDAHVITLISGIFAGMELLAECLSPVLARIITPGALP